MDNCWEKIGTRNHPTNYGVYRRFGTDKSVPYAHNWLISYISYLISYYILINLTLLSVLCGLSRQKRDAVLADMDGTALFLHVSGIY